MDTLRKFIRNPLALAGLLILGFFLALAIAAPYVAPPKYKQDPYRIPRAGFGAIPKAPGPNRPMGTTEGQYDIFYGVVWGTRTAFRVSLIIVGASLAIGLVVGAVAGFYGGRLDEFLMRVTDAFLAYPALIAAIVLTTLLGKGLDKVIVALVLFSWMGYARLIRGNILSVKEMEYVEAARAIGLSSGRILWRYVLPNSIFPVLVAASMEMGSVVITASTLSFLGLGAPPGYADWGQMTAFARNWIIGPPGEPLKYWYTITYPSLAIVLFSLAWNLVGDGLRDTLDPRLRGSIR